MHVPGWDEVSEPECWAVPVGGYDTDVRPSVRLSADGGDALRPGVRERTRGSGSAPHGQGRAERRRAVGGLGAGASFPPASLCAFRRPSLPGGTAFPRRPMHRGRKASQVPRAASCAACCLTQPIHGVLCSAAAARLLRRESCRWYRPSSTCAGSGRTRARRRRSHHREVLFLIYWAVRGGGDPAAHTF